MASKISELHHSVQHAGMRSRGLLRGPVACVACVVLIISGTMVPASALGVVLTRDVTLADLGYGDDDTVHGMRVTRDYSVRWPDAWEVEPGNGLTLRFSHSPALDPRSTLTVEFNGTRLSSVLLTPGNAEDGSLYVALPENAIRLGHNRLRLEFYMGLNDFNCQDLDDPAVWTTIHSRSVFHFSYMLRIPEPNLADFPVPFIDSSRLVENHVTFILPEEPTSSELSAVAAISAKLGQLAAWRTIQLHTLLGTLAWDPDMIMGDVILVGRVDRLHVLRETPPPFLLWKDNLAVLVDRLSRVLPREAGVLWEQLSPFDETAVMLIVTGTTDEAVLTTARALASEASYPRLTGQLGIVLDVPDPPPSDMTIGQMISLEELGYQDYTAWGTQEQSIDYTIPLPLAWQIQSEATLDLHFAHSAITDPDRSFLNVLLNGTPVGSIRLNTGNTEEGRTTFRLPARLFNLGDNSLVVRSNMDITPGYRDIRDRFYSDCLGPDPKEAWLVIYADSLFNLPGEAASVALSLDDYTRAFVGPANLSGMAFIVPDHSDSTIVHIILQIAGRLGRFAEGEALAPHVIAEQELASRAQPPGHLILIGRPTQNPAIPRLDGMLPQPFRAGTDDPEPVASLAYIVPPQGTVGYVQAVMDHEGHPYLIVTGTTDEGMLWASASLSTPELLKELDGDLAIISAGGPITRAKEFVATAEIRPEEARQSPRPPIVEQPALSTTRQADRGKWLAIGLFIISFAILSVVAWPEVRQWWSRKRT